MLMREVSWTASCCDLLPLILPSWPLPAVPMSEVERVLAVGSVAVLNDDVEVAVLDNDVEVLSFDWLGI